MELQFTITDPVYYEKELIKAYETITERTLFPADPERLLLNVITYILALLAFKIDWSAKQNILSFAEGQYLDALAEFYGVKRLPARPAVTTLRFSVDEPLSFDVHIPAGTRVTPDGNIYFKTTESAVIPAGELFVDVQAECETPGSIGNGFEIGQINQFVDVVPYVSKVENISMSLYGADEEDDERFRERIRLSIERFTTAGSRFAYIYHTKTAHQDIEDVEVYSPAPGQVKILFLLKNGELPSENMLNLVSDYLNNEKIRPLTDEVIVSAPQIVNYSVNLTYYIHRKDETKINIITEQVEKAVQDFISWTGSKIGRDVLPEELIRRIKDAGAYRVVLNSPTYLEITKEQVAKGVIEIVSYGGLIDD